MAVFDKQDEYQGLANFMGPHYGSGMGIYKRFSELNALNLLYYQAELANLEQELKAIALVDRTSSDPTRMKFAQSVWDMSKSGGPQWAKVQELRWKLKEYNELLLQQAKLSRMNKPRKHDHQILLDWLLNEHGGNGFVESFEARPFTPDERDDLISISNRANNDIFTRWIEESLLPWLYRRILRLWKKPVSRQEKLGITHFNDHWFVRIARTANITLSTLLPLLAVIGLYFIQNLSSRLGAIVCFSVLFSLVLAVFTSARPVEIFTATAAFASVQVVFVGGTNTGDLSQSNFVCVAGNATAYARV